MYLANKSRARLLLVNTDASSASLTVDGPVVFLRKAPVAGWEAVVLSYADWLSFFFVLLVPRLIVIRIEPANIEARVGQEVVDHLKNDAIKYFMRQLQFATRTMTNIVPLVTLFIRQFRLCHTTFETVSVCVC
jgi:hypothetical protein